MAPQADREERRRKRQAIFDRILQNAPAIFNAAQLRVFLSALVQLDPYIDDVAEAIVGYDENNHRTPEEVLLSTIEGVSDSQLTAFALRLAFTAHIAVPRADETDFLAKAEGVFVPQQPKKEATAKKTVQKGDAKSLKKAAARMPDCGKQGKREKGGLTKTNRCGEESSITTARRQRRSANQQASSF